VLFPSVGALVTDTGGLLSHPAIIAREYRVPAVVATGSATRVLRDGQMVTVDGSTGLVEPLAAGLSSSLWPATSPRSSHRHATPSRAQPHSSRMPSGMGSHIPFIAALLL
jgi:phosphoenolpyruvate-protein kinase (PTS system EI component)